MLEKYADEFQEMYPNVTIQLAGQGDYDGLLSKVTSSIVAGTTPTMLIGYPDHVANYLTANAIEPLDPYVNHIKWVEAVLHINVDTVVAIFQNEHNPRRTILRSGDNRVKPKRNFIHVSVVFYIFKQIESELVQP